MEPTQELADDLYRQRVIRARNTPPEEKLLLGARLFDRACRIMMDGIRDEYPHADEQQVERIRNTSALQAASLPRVWQEHAQAHGGRVLGEAECIETRVGRTLCANR